MAHNRSVYFLSCVGNMTIFSKLSMRATRILMDALSINSFLLHLRSVVAAMVVEVAVLVILVERRACVLASVGVAQEYGLLR
jgi:hypothetical protein